MVKAQLRKGWLWSRRNPVTIVLVLVAGFGWVTLVDTRNDAQVTQRIVEQSPCTAAPAGRECQRLRNEIERARPIRETCIPFRRVGYRCPVGEVREGVVVQQGQSPSQPSGPSGGQQVTVPPNAVTPSVPPSVDKPSPSPPAPVPEPEPEPTAPTPAPVPSEPARPLIDLTPVTDPVCDLTRPIAAIC